MTRFDEQDRRRKKTRRAHAALLAFAALALVSVSGPVLGTMAAMRLYPWYGKVGFIRRDGTVVVPPTYDDIGDFADNGLAPVRMGTRWGYVNAQGKLVIAPRFYAVSAFDSDGIAAVKRDREHGATLIRADGSLLTTQRFDSVGAGDEFDGKLRDSFWGRPLDASGPLEFSHGLLPVAIGNSWHYIGINGKVVIGQSYEQAGTFSQQGLAAVSRNGRWGYIDTQGRMVIEPAFEAAGGFGREGLAVAKRDGKYGYIDLHGSFVVPPRFLRLRDFGVDAPAGMAWAYLDEQHEGLVDRKGHHFAASVNRDES